MYKWRSLNEAIITWIKSTLMLGWGEQCGSWAFGGGVWRRQYDTYSKHILSCYSCPQTIKYQYNCNISSYKHPILYWDRHCLATSNFPKRIHLIDIPWSWTCIGSILSREKTNIHHTFIYRENYIFVLNFSHILDNVKMPTRKAIDKVQPGFC